MKKIYLMMAMGAMTLAANAQQKVANKLTANKPASYAGINSAAKAAANTTLTPSTLNAGGCGTNTANIVYYSINQYTATATYTLDAKGYAFGTNLSYLTQGGTTYTLSRNRAAQKYNVTGTATISAVIVVSAKHSSTAGTSMVTAKIYSENATTKAPGTAVGTPATKALNSFSGSDVISFATPVVVPAGNFFASIESPAMGGATKDTLAITSTAEGCSSTDSLSWEYTQVNGATGFWSSIASGSNANNLDILIFPVADIAPSTVGINSVSKGDLTLLAAYPNPASNEVTINFGLNQNSKVEIALYDVAGKLISTTSMDELQAGNHTKTLDISALGAGVYMYSVKAAGTQLFSKLTVAK